MSNIILVGMPGSGKSTLGIILARRLGYGYLDTDSFISQREKSTLQTIIDTKGLGYFLDTEARVGSEIVCDRVIIATGGSMILSDEAMDNLSSLGTIIYIDVGLDELRKRIGNYSDRGIACNPGETLDDILAQREPLYKKYSDITIKYKAGDSLEETADKIVKTLRELSD
ncbi:MAG: shikimate kinase [Ruminococcus sp.]|nr:shikimate kinase [Ruminococcus sp.]